MADVFLSYARESQALAGRIAAGLVAQGYSVWWDSELLPHHTFAAAIEEQAREAKAVLVVWSEHAVASQWVRAEADLGRSQNKLVQAVADNVQPPLPFNQYQSADLADWHGDPANLQWKKVLASIAHLVGSGAPSMPTDVAHQSPAASWWSKSRRSPWLIALASLAAILVAFAAWFGVHGTYSTEPIAVAVEEFSAAPPDDVGKAVAGRVRDQIAGVLSARQVNVASSSESAKHARLVVAGTVEHHGDMARVRVHIDDRRAGQVIWQGTFEGSGAADGALAEQVAAKATDLAAGGAKVLAESNGAINSDALRAFMLGLDKVRSGSALESLEFYRQFRASAPDSSYAQSAFAMASCSPCPNSPMKWRRP